MLFVPIWDMNHLKRVKFQYVTFGLIVFNTLIYFIFETHLLLHSTGRFRRCVGSEAAGCMRAFARSWITSPQHFRFLTYMFVHGSAWHLFGNMVFLFVFGDNVEDALGHVRFMSSI